MSLEILNNCHLIKKLKDIKNCIQDFNITLSFRIENLINYYEEEAKIRDNKSLLQKKRKREIEFDLSDNETNSSTINDNDFVKLELSYHSLNPKKKSFLERTFS